MHTVYGVAERITVLDVQKARLRVLFTLRLVSGTTIFKSAGGKGLPFVAAHKLFLNGKGCSANNVKGAFHTILPLYGCRLSKIFHTDLLRVFLSNL